MTTSTKFKAWMASTTTVEKTRVAKAAKSSIVTLYHLARGRTKASHELAGKLEKAACGAFSRGDVSSVCRKCPYFKQGALGAAE